MYCRHCMTQLNREVAFCPRCGKPPHEANPPHHLAAGTVLHERYLIGNAIGEGGFGITYMGYDQTLQLKVAVKEYFPTGYANRTNTVSNAVTLNYANKADFYEHGKENFLREAQSIAAFSKERGIVDVRDFFTENNTAYIVMEYLDGVTLGKYVHEHGAISAERLFALSLPLMRALEKMHTQGIIHRDIAPDNLMLLEDGSLKLTDFGAARYFSNEDNKSLSVVLKPGYAPYEQYSRKGKQGPWTDVYALCATIYQCITGVTPPDSLERSMGEALQPPSALGVAMAPALEKALMKGLALMPRERWQDMRELEGAVLSALQAPKQEVQATPAIAAAKQTTKDGNATLFAEDAPALTKPAAIPHTYGDGREYDGGQESDDKKNNASKKPHYGCVALFIIALALAIVGFSLLMIQITSCTNTKLSKSVEQTEEPTEAVTEAPETTEAPKQDLSAEIDAAYAQMKTFSLYSDFSYIKNGKAYSYYLVHSDQTSPSFPTPVNDRSSRLQNNQNLASIEHAHGDITLCYGVNANGDAVTLEDSFSTEPFQSAVSSWHDVTDIDHDGFDYVMALKKDGTLVATGTCDPAYSHALDVGSWTDIKAFVTGTYGGTIGLKKDGTVVYSDTEGWRSELSDIAALPESSESDLFLRKDGTLTGLDVYDRKDILEWTDIIAFSESNGIIVALKKDGTVVASGDNKNGALDVSGWTDIVAVHTDYQFTVGKKSDGTFVIATNDTALAKEFDEVVNGNR